MFAESERASERIREIGFQLHDNTAMTIVIILCSFAQTYSVNEPATTATTAAINGQTCVLTFACRAHNAPTSTTMSQSLLLSAAKTDNKVHQVARLATLFLVQNLSFRSNGNRTLGRLLRELAKVAIDSSAPTASSERASQRRRRRRQVYASERTHKV